ncbi:hypothetical protein CYMTET_3844 [Cymbomonas tetramitiformis]|uniref:Uncharacterized protein n=1 Tax=Cymbomonas tetramitiformis TaxID=36881 RepID=A0AAE0H2H3_9CHLO|nr:hypothetical protein CYMTET_3844 [Cymbomonas tetramitiformis]
MIAAPNSPNKTFALLENLEENLTECNGCEDVDSERCICPISLAKLDSRSDEALVKAPNTNACYSLNSFREFYKTRASDGKVFDPMSGATSERYEMSPNLKKRLDPPKNNPFEPSSTLPADGNASKSIADHLTWMNSRHQLFEDDKVQHIQSLVRDKLVNFDVYHVEKHHLRRAGLVEQALRVLLEAQPLCVEHFRALADDLRAYDLLPLGMLNMVRSRTLHLEPFETLDLTAKGPLFMKDAMEISITKDLHRIGLTDCMLTDELLTPIVGMPSLETIHLARNPSLKLLNLPTISPNLKIISLSECDLTDASLDFIRRAPRIAALDISKNPKLTHKCVTRLVLPLRLKHLSLAHCTGITDEVFEHTSNLRFLRTVIFKGCVQLSENATAEYEKTLRKNYIEEKWHLYNTI